MGFKSSIRKSKNSKNYQYFDKPLRCICWLRQKLVIQHVIPSDVQKIQPYIVEIQFGAEKLMNHAMLPNAIIQFVQNVDFYPEAYAARQLNAKQSRKT